MNAAIEYSISTDEKSYNLFYASALEELARGYVYLYKHEDAEIEYRKSLEIRVKYLANNHALIARSKMFLGRCLRLMLKFDEAEQYLVESLKIYHLYASSGEECDYHDDLVPSHQGWSDFINIESPDGRLKYLNNSSVMLGRVVWFLGCLYCDIKYYQRGTNYVRAAGRMFEESYGNKSCHKDISESQFALAVCSDKMKQYEEADQHFRNSLLIITQIFNPSFIGLLRKVHQSFGTSHLYYKAIIGLTRRLPGYKINHIEAATLLRYFAFHLTHMKHYNLAGELLRKTLQIYQSSKDCKEKESGIAKNHAFIGYNYWKAGKIEQAFESFSMVFQHLEGNDERHATLEVAETHQRLGEMYKECNEFHKAKHHLSLALTHYHDGGQDNSHPKILETQSLLDRIQDSC